MQLTLVSHYGKKPPEFAALICHLQAEVSSAMGSTFRPYGLEQIHGTIMGLEGVRQRQKVRSENCLQLRGEERCFDFDGMLQFLRGEFDGFHVQIGGFRQAMDHGFLSQGQSPYDRSFSVQGTSVVVMGWPCDATGIPRPLDSVRRRLEEWGALRKWAWREGEVDNDFYFVIGRIDAQLTPGVRDPLEKRMRQQLAMMAPVALRISRESLAFVAYTDPRLPTGTSRALKVTDSATTQSVLIAIYNRE